MVAQELDCGAEANCGSVKLYYETDCFFLRTPKG